MSGQYEYLCYLYMLWCIGGIYGYISYIIARKRFDAFIDIGCAIIIAMEADVAEVGLDKTRLQIRYTYCGVGHVDTQSVGKSLDGRLRGTVDIASSIGGIASH